MSKLKQCSFIERNKTNNNKPSYIKKQKNNASTFGGVEARCRALSTDFTSRNGSSFMNLNSSRALADKRDQISKLKPSDKNSRPV